MVIALSVFNDPSKRTGGSTLKSVIFSGLDPENTQFELIFFPVAVRLITCVIPAMVSLPSALTVDPDTGVILSI